MSTLLPERPNLDQLRRLAKELRDAARNGDLTALERVARHYSSATVGEVSLAAAQLVIARELGFSSWPKLKTAVDLAIAEYLSADQFVAASIEGRRLEATALLKADPGLAAQHLRAAVVLGDQHAVRAMLVADPDTALAIDDERGWPPLLYACYSRWHRFDQSRATGLAAVVRLLLDAGASPQTNNGAFRGGYRSALCGAVQVNNPGVVNVLLEAGANPDDGGCVEQAADLRDQLCLELLLARGAHVSGTWALGAAVYADDTRAVTLLIEALRAEKGETASGATNALADAAAANASYEVVATLLAAGADPDVHDSDAGLSALRCAVRAGDDKTAAMLVRSGATDDTTDIDRWIGACVAGDRRRAQQLLSDQPDLREQLTEQDRSLIVGAAASRPAETIALMLDLGFSVQARNGLGEQSLHTAAYMGNASVVRVLLDAHADVDARDPRFEATPLAYATVGSGEQGGKAGDWTGTVRLLIEAGGSREGVWITDKPPSEEVAEVLREYDIAPDEVAELDPDSENEGPGLIGSGPIADVARHLETAYLDSDLELLGSLLHPDVHWSGVCHNKGEVLDWYRQFQVDGTMVTVTSVEVHGDAVVLGLSVSRRAEGARSAPPEHRYQVFTIDDGEVVEIAFYPDHRSALERS